MTALIDHRPLEPDWVSADPLPDIATWTLTRRPWNRETKRYDRVEASGAGDAFTFLSTLADLLTSRNFECQIVVDARGIEPRLDSDKAYLNQINYPDGYDLGIFWIAKPILGEEESGRCTDDLFGWVEYFLNEQKEFLIELSYDDPTP
jgi:hypothetical protein